MRKGESYISRQVRRLSKGQIDRRRFVMSALASGVTMPTALSLASHAEAAQAKPGGHLRYGVSRGTLARLTGRLAGLYQASPDTPNHFTRLPGAQDGQIGHFQEITLLPLAEARARHAAVMTGEVDAVDRVDPRALALFASLPHLARAEHPGARHIALDVPDPELRAALRHGLDRESLLDRLLLGHGAIGHDLPQRLLPKGARPRRFDPARARRHLDPAHPLPLPVNGSEIEGAEALIEVMNTTSEPAGLRFAATHGPAPIRLCEAYGESSAPERLIPLWCNDLVVHAKTLTPDPQHLAPEDVALHWWFA